jgi:hypothetical protein
MIDKAVTLRGIYIISQEVVWSLINGQANLGRQLPDVLPSCVRYQDIDENYEKSPCIQEGK